MQKPIGITGINLEVDTEGNIKVQAEIANEWVTIIKDHWSDGMIIGHIIEPNGILAAIQRKVPALHS